MKTSLSQSVEISLNYLHLVSQRQNILTFAPKLSEIKDKLGKNVHFKLKEIVAEGSYLDRLVSWNPLRNVVTISKGIERVKIEDHYYSDEERHHDEDNQSGTAIDPHIWLVPSNIQKIAE